MSFELRAVRSSMMSGDRLILKLLSFRALRFGPSSAKNSDGSFFSSLASCCSCDCSIRGIRCIASSFFASVDSSKTWLKSSSSKTGEFFGTIAAATACFLAVEELGSMSARSPNFLPVLNSFLSFPEDSSSEHSSRLVPR